METKAQIFYITYDGLCDALGKSQILPYLKELTKKGYRFTILSFEKKERLEKEEQAIKKELDEYGITWKYEYFTSFPPFFSKIRDIVRLYKSARKITEKDQIDIVHCRSYVASLAGLNLKRKKGIPFVFDMRGLWADERIEGKIWNGKNPLFRWAFRYFLKKEKEFLDESDAIVSLTHKGIEVVEKRYTKDFQNKSFVIRTCTDTRIFNSQNITQEQLQKIRNEVLDQKEGFILTYAGSTGTWYMLDEMFRFFEKFLQYKPDAVFLILTQTPEAELRAYYGEIPASRIIVRPVAYSEMPIWLNACDVGIYFIKPLLSKQASTAVKTGEMSACGLPVVANAIGDMEMLFSEYKMGFLVDDMTEKSLDFAAQKLANETMERAEFPPEFSLDSGVIKYAEVYSSVLKNL